MSLRQQHIYPNAMSSIFTSHEILNVIQLMHGRIAFDKLAYTDPLATEIF